jgi:hypothetical protein
MITIMTAYTRACRRRLIIFLCLCLCDRNFTVEDNDWLSSVELYDRLHGHGSLLIMFIALIMLCMLQKNTGVRPL